MDGDPVAGEPSTKQEPQSLTEIFIKVFPYYMVFGMSYDEYWNGPPWLARSYREAYEMKMENEEWARWRMGAYNYHSLLCAAPIMRAAFSKTEVKPGKYPDKPWPVTEEEYQKREEEREKQNFERFIAQL